MRCTFDTCELAEPTFNPRQSPDDGHVSLY